MSTDSSSPGTKDGFYGSFSGLLQSLCSTNVLILIPKFKSQVTCSWETKALQRPISLSVDENGNGDRFIHIHTEHTLLLAKKGFRRKNNIGSPGALLWLHTAELILNSLPSVTRSVSQPKSACHYGPHLWTYITPLSIIPSARDGHVVAPGRTSSVLPSIYIQIYIYIVCKNLSTDHVL